MSSIRWSMIEEDTWHQPLTSANTYMYIRICTCMFMRKFIYIYHLHIFIYTHVQEKKEQMFCTVINKDGREWCRQAKTCSQSGNTFVQFLKCINHSFKKLKCTNHNLKKFI